MDVRMYGRTDGRSRDYCVTTKISRIDRLPYFLSNGAPPAGIARRLRYKQEVNIPSLVYFSANMPSTVLKSTKTSIVDIENLIKLLF